MEQHLNTFKTYLKTKGYNPNTVRNYLADVHKYLDFVKDHFPSVDSDITAQLDHQPVSAFLQFVADKNNGKRYLASLNSFCQFALDQKLISKNPLKTLKQRLDQTPQVSVTELIDEFKAYLSKKGKTESTVKNYINDIQQYLTFCQNHLDS